MIPKNYNKSTNFKTDTKTNAIPTKNLVDFAIR